MKTSYREITNILESDFVERRVEKEVMSQEDIRFMQLMNKKTCIDEKGFYEMPLPFKKDCPRLPNNRFVVEKRLEHLNRKLNKSTKLLEDYKDFMKMMLVKEYAAPCSEDDDINDVKWYIPHHAVYKSDKTRVVFDCSAQYQHFSLNQCLIQGPDLLNSMITVLCKFREHPIAIMGDIENMFYRFKVKKEHRNYLRFLWWKDGDLSQKPSTYRMTVHIFGATSSPGSTLVLRS